jgi:O-antigen/teichoic acid export membrane protein
MTLKKVASFAIGPIGAAALGLITLPFIAWFFSVEDIGRLTMLQVVLKLSVALLSLQLHQAYVREYHEHQDKQMLLKAAALPGLLALVFVFIILIFFPYSISFFLFDVDDGFLLFLLLVSIAATFIINLLAHVLRMQERGLAFSATQLMPKITLLVLISLVLVFSWGASFELLMFASALSFVSSGMMFLWLTRKVCLSAIRKPVDRPLIYSMLKFSLPLVGGSLAYWGLTTMDRFFLRSLSSFGELGIYAMAASLAAAVSVLSTVFSNLWHPVVYKWINEGVNLDRVRRVIEVMAIAVAVIWTLVGLFSWVLVDFLPVEYGAIEYLIVACVAMPLLYTLSETTVIGIGISRKSNFSMISSFSAFLVNAILNYFLIPEYGASGAAIASVIAFFVFFAVRTEASAYLWWSFPRLKLYIVIVSYCLGSIYVVLEKKTIEFTFFVWLALLLMTLMIFFNRLCELIKLTMCSFEPKV